MTDDIHNRPQVAVFDLDRTLTRRATWTPFVLFVMCRHPRRWLRLPFLVPEAVRYVLGRSSRKAIKEAMMRVAMTGLSRRQMANLADAFVGRLLARGLRAKARSAIRGHRDAGDRLILATASMDFYSKLIAERLGIDTVVCTRSTWSPAGRIVPTIDGENCYGPAKLDAIMRAMPLPRSECRVIAYSDHASDLPLLEWADKGVAVNPRRRFRNRARSLRLNVVDWNLE